MMFKRCLIALCCLFSTLTHAELPLKVEGRVIYVGDSIAVMTRNAAIRAGIKGITKFTDKDFDTAIGGKNPKWIYERINKVANEEPDFFNDKIIVLSSGYSNDPTGKYIDYHEKILQRLTDLGVRKVRMLGMANNFYIHNKYGTHYYDENRHRYLVELARKYQAAIYPEFDAFDRIHPNEKVMKGFRYGLK